MKRIVICCDGTWNTPKQVDQGVPAPTNVVKLACAIEPRTEFVPITPTTSGHAIAAGPPTADWEQLQNADTPHVKGPAQVAGAPPGAPVTAPLSQQESPTKSPQLVYYHPGVGTSGGKLARIWDAISGWGISTNIRDAYRFVIQNYQPGDQLFLFGFSRGAFTVRSLAGLIRNCGILKLAEIGRVRQAFRFYRSHNAAKRPRSLQAAEFRAKYAVEDVTPIEFIGVWDTVGELGNPLLLKFGNEFHDVSLSTAVRNAYHAVSIDEKRKPFKPTLWQRQYDTPPEVQARMGVNPDGSSSQKLEQVWFCGTHTNVGGGYQDANLSNVALQWMIEKARDAGLQIDLVTAQASPLGILRESWTGFWRWLGRLDRPIDEPDPNTVTCESLNRSVALRWQNNDGTLPLYRPPNLEAYYQRHSDQRPIA